MKIYLYVETEENDPGYGPEYPGELLGFDILGVYADEKTACRVFDVWAEANEEAGENFIRREVPGLLRCGAITNEFALRTSRYVACKEVG